MHDGFIATGFELPLLSSPHSLVIFELRGSWVINVTLEVDPNVELPPESQSCIIFRTS